MLYVGQLKHFNPEQFDRSYAIVRSAKYLPPNVQQLACLSPSWDLFLKYREHVQEGTWGMQAFMLEYVPQFLSKLLQNSQAIHMLNQLAKAEDNIMLACYCAEEELCHRSIIAGLLQGAGCDVRTSSGADFSVYYKIYKNLKERLT